MSPSNWGPPTWIFFHTICEKIKDENFSVLGQSLLNQIKNICYHLPCPDCTMHSKEFWSKVQIGNIKTKQDLINLIYIFHNVVNKRRGVSLFKHENLYIYKTKNIIETFNVFSKNFNTRGNMNLINESFHRNIMLQNLRKWIMNNIKYFHI
jgi:hypothetical protein